MGPRKRHHASKHRHDRTREVEPRGSSGADETSSLFLFPEEQQRAFAEERRDEVSEEQRSDFIGESQLASSSQVAVLASNHITVVNIEAATDTLAALEFFAPESTAETLDVFAAKHITEELALFAPEGTAEISTDTVAATSFQVHSVAEVRRVTPELHLPLMFRRTMPAFGLLTLGVLMATLPLLWLDFGKRHANLIARHVLASRTLSFDPGPTTRVAHEHAAPVVTTSTTSRTTPLPAQPSFARAEPIVVPAQPPLTRAQPTATRTQAAPLGPQESASEATVPRPGTGNLTPATTPALESQSLVSASVVTAPTTAAALLTGTTASENMAPSSESLASPDLHDENGVRRTVRRYQQAYGDLDVVATAAIWPSVDHRALSRAFNSLKSQDLAFDSCKTTVDGSSATVACRGSIRYVRKVGAPGPSIERYEWRFNLRKIGDDWKIAGVTASQSLAQLAENADHGS